MLRTLTLLATLALVTSSALADLNEALDLLDSAEQYLAEGNHRAAVIELKNAAKAAPDSAEVRLRLGQTYLELGDPRAATKELRRAMRLGAADAEVVPPLAEALIGIGDIAQAIDAIDSTGRPTPELLVLRGNAYLGMGDRMAAAADYNAALKKDPKSVPALLAKARLELTQGLPNSAMPLASRALAMAPASAEVWTVIGHIESTRGRHPAARAAFEQALRLTPDDPVLGLAMATTLMAEQDYPAARDQLDRVAADSQNDPRYLTLAAALALAQGDAAAAEAQLQPVVTHYPNYAAALLTLGKALLELNSDEQATEVLKRYHALDPDSAEGVLLLAHAWIRVGATREAAGLLQPLAEQYPNQLEVLEARHLLAVQQQDFELAETLSQQITNLSLAQTRIDEAGEQLAQGDTGAAMASFDGALAVQPTLLQPRLAKFRQALRERDLDAAEAIARELAAEMPDAALPALFLGAVALGRGDTTAARAQFEKAWKHDPGNPAVARRLALFAADEGDWTAATGYYLDVLSQHPGHTATLERLANLAFTQGDLDQAIAYLEQSVDQQPTALAPRLKLANALAKQDRATEAVAHLVAVDTLYGERIDYLRALTRYQMQTDPAKSVPAATRLLAAAPDDPRHHLFLAEAHGRNGNARALYQAMHDGLSLAVPTGLDSRTLIRLAALGSPETPARETLERLHDALPDNGEVARAVILLAIAQGRDDDALTLVRDMRQRDPEHAGWMTSEAEILLHTGQTQAAEETLAAWRRAHPQDPAADLFEAKQALGRQDTDAAVNAYREVLKKAPDHLEALNNIAWLTRESDPAGALQMAQRAVELNDDAELLDTLGAVLMANDQPKQAVGAFRLAVKGDPTSSAKVFHLAEALAASGRRALAARLLSRLLQRPGEFAERAQAKALLAELQPGA